ncbi:hypothetical protein KEM48_011045 [Puccinia striiformis f. sp. tritici PST-130]|nr:hypothetical protein KEM48_011045 [Puccinia striiformis f. sp. tritici PST-130]
MINLSITQKAALALFALFLMRELDKEDLLPYYGDGGQATHFTDISTTFLEHWPISTPNTQVQLVYAITMLWNFLRHHDQYEDIPEVDEVAQANQEEDDNLNLAATGNLYCRSRADDTAMICKCNRLADKMWNQYQQYTSQR